MSKPRYSFNFKSKTIKEIKEEEEVDLLWLAFEAGFDTAIEDLKLLAYQDFLKDNEL